MKRVWVINCGSSSIKYKLYDMTGPEELASGLIERIGEATSQITHHTNGETVALNTPVKDYEQGVDQILHLLTSAGSPPPLQSKDEIDGVGHRVVHGAEDFSDSVVVTDEVLDTIEKCVDLAPLHNPANLAGLKAVMAALPGVPQVGVFDTAFFQTMPAKAYMYAVPHEWYAQYRVRRYGFHGTSHRYVAGRAAELMGVEKPNLVSLHLGNGCSMTCIKEGRAVDQTMGLTPLEGLVMGTRSGDIDPAIIFHMNRQGLELADIRKALEKQSGLQGLSGVARDLRDVKEAADAGDERAQLAMDVFAHRARKYVGAFLAELGHCDGIVFTGGIGENAAFMREAILSGMEPLGIELDGERNAVRASEPRQVSTDQSRTSVWVIPTNEELMIALDTVRLMG